MSFAFHRVWAVMLRYLFSERRNVLRLSDALYWPFLDIMIWGLTTTWMQQQQVQVPNLVLVMLTGIVLWQVVMRAHYEITITLMEEMWNRSFVSLFATPLTIWEWIVSVMLNGLVKTVFVLFFGVTIVWLLYGLNILSIGWILVPFSLSLIVFGWVIGFLGAAVIIYYGQKAQNLPWVMAFLFVPVSGIYYPIDILPSWLQCVAYCLPIPYIFEGMRTAIFTGQVPWWQLGVSYVLNVLYLVATIKLFVFMFNKSRAHGLDRL